MSLLLIMTPYRHPLEAAIWENGFLGPLLLLSLCALVMTVLLFTGMEKIIRKNGWRKHTEKIHRLLWLIIGVFYVYGLHYIATK
jgi:hypothetical protein